MKALRRSVSFGDRAWPKRHSGTPRFGGFADAAACPALIWWPISAAALPKRGKGDAPAQAMRTLCRAT
jgi:hypothetical protein